MNIQPKFCFLSGNMLKIIAAISMLIDHMGLMFFPGESGYRIIGRIAFPIFAFMIAEGCKYTRNRLRYFLTIAGLAAVCQIVYYIVEQSTYMSVLVTFSLSILMIFALQNFKEIIFSHKSTLMQKVLSASLFMGSVAAVWLINVLVTVDYGFFGCMMPVFACLLHCNGRYENHILKKLDVIPVSIILMSIPMTFLTLSLGGAQIYSFFALIPLFLYSGKRGAVNMKYFFYVFYPLHLVALEGIYMLIRY